MAATKTPTPSQRLAAAKSELLDARSKLIADLETALRTVRNLDVADVCDVIGDYGSKQAQAETLDEITDLLHGKIQTLNTEFDDVDCEWESLTEEHIECCE